ncbi:MAG TPA: ammonia channel protein [Gallionella sp.]|jgi:Amt family ammonium transporter|nr:ammonium transporter [Gallionella sp.]OGS68427.1 MAG: ammonia channel protein [Gallionellales bacterium GWA2_54_124]OGT24651.1 MAG: ammonia channel protein [Gallionellales bacterium RIFOXYD2_FULL_52_7]HCI54150.1 ammonia channel protein [Gallionella sp.]
MRKIFASFMLIAALCGLSAPGFAEEAASAVVSATEVASAVVSATEAAPVAEAVVAAAPVAAPVPNKGDTSWMLVATLLVIMMSIPGLALFYGGLVRSKNMLSILMQVFSIFALITVLWAIYGYSLAFTEGNAFIGGFDRLFLKGIFDPMTGSVANAATFSKGVVIPEFIFVAFQATFAAITVALIVGAFAERMKFSAVMLFSGLWFTFAYLPIAHMVWFWTGPDAIKDAATLAVETVKAGWLFQKGALDFAGGTVVHINAAVAGLVGAFMVGKRIGYGKEPMAPHNLVMTMIGAALLWVGWFGFNAGSALEAGGTATLAFANTLIATAAAVLTWLAAEWLLKGKPSLLGAASGAVAGLVAITPACGWVGIGGGLVIGALSGVVCFWGVTGLKKLLGADDALDVFGIHGIGGILGALLTGVFNSWSMGGTGIADYVNNTVVDTVIADQVWIQAQAVLTTVIWSGVVAFVCYKIVDLTIGLRVAAEEEREGLDTSSHGERAYNY